MASIHPMKDGAADVLGEREEGAAIPPKVSGSVSVVFIGESGVTTPKHEEHVVKSSINILAAVDWMFRATRWLSPSVRFSPRPALTC